MTQNVSATDVLSQNDSMLREFFAKLVRGELGFHDHHIYWNRDKNTLFSSLNNPPGELDPASTDCVNVFTAARGDQTFIEFGGEAGGDELVDDDYINESDFGRFLSRVEGEMFSASI